MSQTRRTMNGLILFALLITLTGCALPQEAPGASGDSGSIWVLLPDSATSARWETDDRRFFMQAFEEYDVAYNIVNAEGDARAQQTQAEQAITAGAEVLLLVSLDPGSGAAIVAMAREAGVDIIDYDRLTIQGPGADVYVSFDNVEVGRKMGLLLEERIPADGPPPSVVLLNGGFTDYNATLYREGVLSVAQPHFDDGSWLLVADESVPGWDNQQGLMMFEQILTTNPDVSVVFAANDGLANSVITAFRNAGIVPADEGILISGQDATIGGIQNILAGDQTMTTYKPLRDEVYAAVEVAVRLLHDQPIDDLTGGRTINNGMNDIPFIALEPIGVTIDNIHDTVIADGFRSWDEICVGLYAAYCPETE